jgi:hypothetical protein
VGDADQCRFNFSADVMGQEMIGRGRGRLWLSTLSCRVKVNMQSRGKLLKSLKFLHHRQSSGPGRIAGYYGVLPIMA